MRTFLSLPCGRIASVSTGFLLAAAGGLAIAGPGPHFFVLMPIAMVGIVGFILAVVLAVDYWQAALTMVLVLPVLAGVYLAGLHVVVNQGALVGAVLFGAGAIASWMGGWGYRRLAS